MLVLQFTEVLQIVDFPKRTYEEVFVGNTSIEFFLPSYEVFEVSQEVRIC